MDQAGAVGAGLVGDGGDERRAGLAHLLDGFGDAILADDGDMLGSRSIRGRHRRRRVRWSPWPRR